MANLKKTVIADGSIGSNPILEVTGKIKINHSTAPLEVNSSDVVSNLNADLLDGKHADDFISSNNLESELIAAGFSNKKATETELGLVKVKNTATIDYVTFEAASDCLIISTISGSKVSGAVQDSANLGGRPAAEYALKSDVPDSAAIADDANKLGGIDASKYLYKHEIKTAGQFDTTTTMPTSADRLNYDGYLYATRVYGAVFNDYAETRLCDTPVHAGFVVCDTIDDKVMLCTEDLCRTAYIVTDTYGMLIGEQDKQVVPVALTGRVLAFLANKSEAKIGDAVCASSTGILRTMTKDEELQFPLSILGVVSGIPNYAKWHDVSVNGRVWIKIKN